MSTSQSGQRWSMIHGDSLLALRDLPDGSVDAVITDPPYSSGGLHRSDRNSGSADKYGVAGPEFSGDNRDQRSFLAWCSLWMAECIRLARPGAPIAAFSDWRQVPTVVDAIQVAGWVLRGIAVWSKPPGTFRSFSGRLGQACEFVVWGTHGERPIEKGVRALPGHWHVAPPKEGREHATEKPIEVMRDLVKLCSDDGVVLDPFAGSATTGCAALLEGRRFLGLELSKEYYPIACRRLAETEAGAERGSLQRGQGALFGALP